MNIQLYHFLKEKIHYKKKIIVKYNIDQYTKVQKIK